MNDLRQQLEKLISFAITCRRENTDEWMKLFTDSLQNAADAAAIDITIGYDGRDAIHFQSNVPE